MNPKSDGTIERYNALLVAKGMWQIEGVDYHETFSPMVKAESIRLVLTITVTCGWKLSQVDISNAFLHGLFEDRLSSPNR